MLQGCDEAAEVRCGTSGEMFRAHPRQHHRQHVHVCAEGDALPAVRGLGRHPQLGQRQRHRSSPHVSAVSFTHSKLGLEAGYS